MRAPAAMRCRSRQMNRRSCRWPFKSLVNRFCRNSVIGDDMPMLPLHLQLSNSALRRVIKRLHYPLEVMLVCVRWYAAYPMSLRNLEEMMEERGVLVDHATIHRWALKMLPVLAAVFRRRKLQVGSTWRVDETYVLVGGQWRYLYRAASTSSAKRWTFC